VVNITDCCKGLTLALTLLGAPAYSQTATVNIDGTNFDFSVVTGTYNSLLETLSAQFWWTGSYSSSSSALDTASAVGSSLGFPNSTYLGPSSPIFAFHMFSGAVFSQNSQSAEFLEFNNDTQYSFAIAATSASSSPTPVPEINGKALPVLAFILFVTFLFIRSRRARLMVNLA
jgi:hypothetical protein